MENGRRKTTQVKQFAGALTDIPDAVQSEEIENMARVRADPFFELRGLVQQQDRKGES
ncbi:hypothetical protein SAMN04515691_0474 [Leifsonia sp. 98AMF]|nr:hypothetical protein SAMN04515690_3545 [Leifsonia sp. 197AMF]SDI73094.1 hypothetical protein SAMN04515684_0244 [Leifsonia sp. 466MF]SDK15418.1 hypothetical protein SAMN04515683_2506 [Leifsonia sp. 157MF]SDN76067.1 hypothetical protein SAMN04515686_2445 [Leifsonia sp. 509MF]SEN32000.1 hypothetical protein SAMN04515685_2491 [Leifsonia sp. 467MF]SFL74578.1 hypothetical protein SAMN04515691_0474 [Leifsonia sp. 98AMF]